MNEAGTYLQVKAMVSKRKSAKKVKVGWAKPFGTAGNSIVTPI